jgi:hypothetical protein
VEGDRVFAASGEDGLTILNKYTPLRVIIGPHSPQVYWDLGTLQFSPNVNAPWTDLPAASPFQLSPIGEKGFFRVKVEP